MAKGFAIHNAPTDHGGFIPATQMRSSQMGNLFVVAGDGHFCPKCKCWSTVIKSHDHVLFDGKAVAYVGDLLTCGARIQPQQSHVVGESGGGNYKDTRYLVKELIMYSGQYQLVNDTTNQPYSNVRYTVTYADGRIIEGVTDANGMTNKLEGTEKAEDIVIKLFEAEPC